MPTRHQILACTTALTLALFIGGCSYSPPISSRQINVVPSSSLPQPAVDAFAKPASPPVLRVDDKISVSVAREADLSLAEVRVGEDGTINIPYIGAVPAAGRTTAEIAKAIQQELGRNYLLDPRVSVNVIEYGSHTVVVEGSVAHPGSFPFPRGTTLLGAIAIAEGPTRVAKLDRIAIFRSIDGQRSVAVFDIGKLRSGRQPDPLIEPGDRVVVGLSNVKQLWQDFLQAAPAVGLFARLP